MPGTAVRRATVALLLAAVALAPAAAAHRHRREPDAAHHGRHGSAPSHPRDAHAARSRHHAPPAASRRDAGRERHPTGATAVPAGGLKLSCAGRTGPLLVRKMTQGNGTTVTVICR